MAGNVSPKISVLMPVKNGEGNIPQAAASILNQKFRDFELLIIDDGSTDSTPQIIESLSLKDQRVKAIKQGDSKKGVSSAMNEGLKAAMGEYIARMDADDVSLPDRFEKQVKFLDSNPKVIAVGMDAISFGEKTRLMTFSSENNRLKLRLPRSTCFVNSTAMFRRRPVVENHLFYSEQMNISEDWDYWVKMLPFGNFANINQIGLYYRVHPQSVTSSSDEETRALSNKKVKIGLNRTLGLPDNAGFEAAAAALAEKLNIDDHTLGLEVHLNALANSRKNWEWVRCLSQLFSLFFQYPFLVIRKTTRRAYYQVAGALITTVDFSLRKS